MNRSLAGVGFACAIVLLPPTAAAQTARPRPSHASLAQSLTGAAKDDYASAQILSNNGDFASALAKYGEAYDLSKDPRLLFNMALCARSLHAYAQMQSLLTRYRHEAGSSISPEDKADVDAALSAIHNLVGALRLTVSEPEASIAVDGGPVGTSPLSDAQVLDLGKHVVVVNKPGFETVTQTVTISGGSEASITVALVPERHVAQLVVTSSDGATVVIDGKVAGKGRFEGQLAPGVHDIAVTEPGKIPYSQQIELHDGETRTAQVTLSNEGHGATVWPWIVAGVAVATGAAVGGYFLFKPQPSASGAPPDQLGSLQLSAWGR
jgi:hypothetical protein